MRMSQLFLPTERQPPADAEALSHKLMVRAGLVRQLGAGLWTWLPAGWRTHQRIVQIVREEIDAIGGQEMLMPVLQPAELWKRSGRYDAIGGELFRLKDRKGADMVLAMTHEEAVTYHAAQSVRSYRDLPMILYHFQVKERDEPRPRAGVLRTREFIMKDSYSFDRDEEGLQANYERHREAYARIYDRAGLDWYECESDVGMMGGARAHEYMAPCTAGEDDVVLGPNGYSANLEIATADAQPVPALPDSLTGTLDTPGQTTIEAVAGGLGVQPGNLLKAFPIIGEERGPILVFVRGDHRVGEIKLSNALGEKWRPARDEELPGPAGYLGPKDGVLTFFDQAIEPGRYVVGANAVDRHEVYAYEGGQTLDVRSVEPGDTIGGEAVRIEPAIEIGNIFQLGTRYSVPLGLTYLDENGKEHPVVMGSYGIGPARIAAAAVEQYADEKGIAWPKAIAPFDVEVVALGKPGTPELEAAERVYEQLVAVGFSVLLDDRAAGPGEKFADAELLGAPLRLTIGKRSLESGAIEAQLRRGMREVEGGIPLKEAAEGVRTLWPTIP
ncbi:MAG TPA: proline--tRNA ligase [Baekduia sp.]|uniref:proline--tRNA ligase n=1 Tax=Baekduia sp. TaxID=2600305 RepID=UPI002D766E4B|nr:proline--tRNA ligase [Baekduia sp.]HET6506355.1 proline--tRNA ligase [Baekduia sp.]